jgi:hypothetical protein
MVPKLKLQISNGFEDQIVVEWNNPTSFPSSSTSGNYGMNGFCVVSKVIVPF